MVTKRRREQVARAVREKVTGVRDEARDSDRWGRASLIHDNWLSFIPIHVKNSVYVVRYSIDTLVGESDGYWIMGRDGKGQEELQLHLGKYGVSIYRITPGARSKLETERVVLLSFRHRNKAIARAREWWNKLNKRKQEWERKKKERTVKRVAKTRSKVKRSKRVEK